jgi:N-methylhydantoinase A/oxoprolinase/acetone carboxylase beta subunit
VTEKSKAQNLYLGIDTGGTFTDAVILNAADSSILCSNKALTTRHNLGDGLERAMRKVIDDLPTGSTLSDVKMVSISTTLATNALVEGDGSPVCAIFIGYEQAMIDKSLIREKLGDVKIFSVCGGHDSMAREIATLNEFELEKIVREQMDAADAFAISAQFSVRNPLHELRAKEIINRLCDKPVTCGHELTSALDAPRRALTTALNASLIPKIRGLILAVRRCMTELELEAPLMVVKGDGTVVAADMVQQRPIETILSGPAASMIGAQALSGRDDFILSDMGGTTTDVGVLLEGRVKLNDEGAIVGGARTMIQAIDLRTFALGGDSLVDIDRDDCIQLGPRRAIPISLTGRDEGVCKELKIQLCHKDIIPFSGWFAVMQREHPNPSTLDPRKREILNRLREGPCALDHIIISPSHRRHLNEMCRAGYVSYSGFTPTDALHVSGEFTEWSSQAAELGAAAILRWRRGIKKPAEAQIEQFCDEVRDAVQINASRNLLELALQSHDTSQHGIVLARRETGEPFKTLISRGYKRVGLASVGISLNASIVAVGAPVKAYYPEIGRRLGCDCVMPKHFEVANAVGAVTGLIIQGCQVLISRPGSGAYRVHLSDGLIELETWHQALELARTSAAKMARDKAQRAGAATTKVEYSIDKIHLPGTSGDDGIIEATIRAEAIGRPTPVSPKNKKANVDLPLGLH